MTKNEIRILSISKLQLFPGAIVYDIGAGSGSVAIECKRFVGPGQVYAIERKPEAIAVIRENSERFGMPIQIIEGEAPAAIEGLPEADRIFVGGTGGNLQSILNRCDEQLAVGGRIVVNSVTMTTASDTCKFLEQMGYRLDVIQVNIANIIKRGNSDMWQARNPVTIITAEKMERPADKAE